MSQSTTHSRLQGPASLVAVATILLASVCQAQQPQRDRDQLSEPVYRVSNARTDTTQSTARQLGVERDYLAHLTTQERQHPLAPALHKAYLGLNELNGSLVDYSATLVKRERVDGKLLDHEYIFVKVRQEQRDTNENITVPFGVYMHFVGPNKIKGRECLWIRGENKGKMVAHEGGKIMSLVSVWLHPTSPLAMKGNRYPISEIGIQNLIVKLIEKTERDIRTDDCEVKFFENAKVAGRSCTCIQVMHQVKRAPFDFYLARVFVDNQLNLPIRYAAWEWPSRKGGAPVLLEEYTYTNLKINNNFTNADFSYKNKQYSFNSIRSR